MLQWGIQPGHLNKNLEDKFVRLSTQIQQLQSNVTETKEHLQMLESDVIDYDSRIDALESLKQTTSYVVI